MTAQWWQCTNPEALTGRCRFVRQAQDDDLYMPRVMSGKPVLVIDAVPHVLATDPRGYCLCAGNPDGGSLYLHVFCETPPPLGDWAPYEEGT